VVAPAINFDDHALRIGIGFRPGLGTRAVHLYIDLTFMTLPPPLRWLKDKWMAFSHVLGIIMSRIILTVFWLIGIGVYGIGMKIFMLFKKKGPQNTYWVPSTEETPESMQYQF
jgi:hypothetical protein